MTAPAAEAVTVAALDARAGMTSAWSGPPRPYDGHESAAGLLRIAGHIGSAVATEQPAWREAYLAEPPEQPDTRVLAHIGQSYADCRTLTEAEVADLLAGLHDKARARAYDFPYWHQRAERLGAASHVPPSRARTDAELDAADKAVAGLAEFRPGEYLPVPLAAAPLPPGDVPAAGEHADTLLPGDVPPLTAEAERQMDDDAQRASTALLERWGARHDDTEALTAILPAPESGSR